MSWGVGRGLGVGWGGTTALCDGSAAPFDPAGPDPRTECTPRVDVCFGALRICWSGMVAPWGQLSFEPPASATTAAWRHSTGHPDSPGIKGTGSHVLHPWPGGQPVGKCHFRASWKDPEGKTQPAFSLCRVNVPKPSTPFVCG